MSRRRWLNVSEAEYNRRMAARRRQQQQGGEGCSTKLGFWITIIVIVLLLYSC